MFELCSTEIRLGREQCGFRELREKED